MERLKDRSRPLPELEFPSLTDGTLLPVRSRGRTSRILFIRHANDCHGCEVYLGALARHRLEIEEWDGRVLVVRDGPVDGDGSDGGSAARPYPVAIDATGRLAVALSAGAPAVVIADQWGDVHLQEEGGSEHRLPPVEEVIDWLRYLAIQCPECEGEVL